MFDFSSILELAKIEPGSGFAQCCLLAMIWWQSKGLRKDMNRKFENHEKRIIVLEVFANNKIKGE